MPPYAEQMNDAKRKHTAGGLEPIKTSVPADTKAFYNACGAGQGIAASAITAMVLNAYARGEEPPRFAPRNTALK